MFLGNFEGFIFSDYNAISFTAIHINLHLYFDPQSEAEIDHNRLCIGDVPSACAEGLGAVGGRKVEKYRFLSFCFI